MKFHQRVVLYLNLTIVTCFFLIKIFELIKAPHKFYIGFRYVKPLTEHTIAEMEKYYIMFILQECFVCILIL